jgi:putative transposase
MEKMFDRHGIHVSMSRKGDPWDNAMQESFFGTLKTEWADHAYESHAEARKELFKYIELFYNPRRRHSSLGNISPVEYERRWENGTLPPANQAA